MTTRVAPTLTLFTLMRLLVIRHAIAEDREAFARTGADDSTRPLIDEGRRKMRGAAAGLRTLVPGVDRLASSPFTRALQTAEIVAGAYGGLSVETADVLRPESRPGSFLQWIQGHEAATVAVVGHEPHLGILTAWLVTGVAEPWLPLKKGGACLLEFERAPRAGGARLAWLVSGGVLRKLVG